ncbi:MAG: nitroreductase family protein [Clostridiales Family XIII bacterium]|jgi:nitroreductase|nr:nitroreductase family protein [Clostridiales Family XIII bacterium]
MDAKELLLTRRSVRSFTDKRVDRDVLKEALRVSTYAPTGMGRQSPLLVCVSDDEAIETLKKLNASILGMDIDPYYGAKTIILAFGKAERVTCVEDATSLLVYLGLALYGEGIGSCWVHRMKQVFELPEGKKLIESWDLPEGYVAVGSLAVGYPDGEHPTVAERKKDYIIYK